MKAKFRYAGVGLALLGLAVSAAGCRKDLCYDHDAHSLGCRALVTAVWEREWERDYGLGWLAGWDAAAYGRAYDDLRPDGGGGHRHGGVRRSGESNRRERRVPPVRRGRQGQSERGQLLAAVLQRRHGVHRLQRHGVAAVGQRHDPHADPRLVQRTPRGGADGEHSRHALRAFRGALRGRDASGLGGASGEDAAVGVHLPRALQGGIRPAAYRSGARRFGGHGRERLSAGRPHGRRGGDVALRLVR